MTKHIFVTGGVVSSLGKGLTSASIGMLLEHRGLSVRMQKLDPYINTDPGKLSPAQHGEVYVLDDGSTCDLDLGHYERFTNSPLTKDSSWTSGQIYQRVFEKERRGEYNGATVQVIPHITNETKKCIENLEGNDVDVVITEIGGTVGDIESLPFLEAIRQFSLDVGKENCLYIHLTLVPYLKAAKELKTKPTQHSVGQMRQIGIQPDILICRTERPIPEDEKRKIALFCNVPTNAVIEERDKDFSIYEVPMSLVENGLDQLIVDRLGLKKAGPLDLAKWHELMDSLRHPEHDVTIAVVGEFTDYRDAYKSVYEALDHAGIANKAQIRIVRIAADSLENGENRLQLMKVDGIYIAGGPGERAYDGKIMAAQIARENNIPCFASCTGMQCAVLEFARNVCGLADADSTAINKETSNPIICLPEKPDFNGKTMRLGSYPAVLQSGSLVATCYGTTTIAERHRHRYELNNEYRGLLAEHGMVVTGNSPDGCLAEIIEIPSHPWFVGVQFQPEFKSQPINPHPLFLGFTNAAIARRKRTG